jgi:hypothetical protein
MKIRHQLVILAVFPKNPTFQEKQEQIFYTTVPCRKHAAASYFNCFVLMNTKEDRCSRAEVLFTFFLFPYSSINGKRSGAFEYNVTMEHTRSSLRVAEVLLSNGKQGTLIATN